MFANLIQTNKSVIEFVPNFKFCVCVNSHNREDVFGPDPFNRIQNSGATGGSHPDPV